MNINLSNALLRGINYNGVSVIRIVWLTWIFIAYSKRGLKFIIFI